MEMDGLTFNKKHLAHAAMPMLAPTSSFKKGNRLVFHDGIVIAPQANKTNELRAAGKLPKLTRYVMHLNELPLKARKKVFLSDQYNRRKALHEQIERVAEGWPNASPEPWEGHVLGPLATEVESFSEAYAIEYDGSI
jgi:hypothetical protein